MEEEEGRGGGKPRRGGGAKNQKPARTLRAGPGASFDELGQIKVSSLSFVDIPHTPLILHCRRGGCTGVSGIMATTVSSAEEKVR